MPTYQYACTACGHELEAVQSFSDAALTECPDCAGALRKVFSAVGVVFKGSGFYKTDSRAKSTSASTTSSSSSGSSGSSGSSDKPSESKPAAKSESTSSGTSSSPASSSSSSG